MSEELSLFDLSTPPPTRRHMGGKIVAGRADHGTDRFPDYRPNYEDRLLNPNGAPPLDWWIIDEERTV